MGTMMDYEEYSPKEQLQLTVCQRLIAEKGYLSQEEIGDPPRLTGAGF